MARNSTVGPHEDDQPSRPDAAGRRPVLRLDSPSQAMLGPLRPPVSITRRLAGQARETLDPRGPLEDLLVGRIIQAATLLLDGSRDAGGPWMRASRLAERSLGTCLAALDCLRRLARPDAASPAGCLLRQDSSGTESDSWRERLTFDASVSAEWPVVQGTWITVDQVISRVVDGWSWDDLIRVYPELTVDDIRACLTYAIEDEEGR